MKRPVATVIMAVYNDVTYVSQAIQSILHQSFRDFQFIIIDDASDKETKRILHYYAKKDKRIFLLENKKNLGLTHSLKIALSHSIGEIIVRMDADDLSRSDRLEKQVAYLAANQEVMLLGSVGEYIDKKGELIGKKYLPITYEEIKRKLLFNNQFIHSGICFRKKVIDELGGYDESFQKSQDYEFVLRVAAKYQVVNLPEPLIKWRVTQNSISWSGKRQEWDAIRARFKAILKFGYPKHIGIIHILLRLFWLLIPQSYKRKRYES